MNAAPSSGAKTGTSASAGAARTSAKVRPVTATASATPNLAKRLTTPRGSSGRLSGSAKPRNSVITGSSSPDPDSWQVWWDRNRESYLAAGPSSSLRSASTAARSSLVGSAASRANASHGPSTTVLYTEVVPGLLELLSTETDPQLLAAAALALGRTAAAPFDGPVSESLIPLLAHNDLQVQIAASLGLGLLGHSDGLSPLMELASCSQRGHALCGRDQVPVRLRNMALLSIGLLGDLDAVERLLDVADRLPDSDDSLRAGAVLALGALGRPAATHAASWLTEASADRRLPYGMQSSLPTALGRVSADTSAAALLALLADRDADSGPKQAAFAALGASLAVTDGPGLQALMEAAVEQRDAAGRHLALLALARATARSSSSSVAEIQARGQVARLLSQQLRRPEHSLDRPWIALAAGIVSRGDALARAQLGPLLLDAYADAAAAEQRGAAALALGLGVIPEAGELLLADFLDTRDPDLQAHLALALGLLGEQRAVDDLRRTLVADGQQSELRFEVATALRLLGDAEAVGALARAYPDADSTSTRDSMARALGELRHRDGLPALLAAARNVKLPARDRAAACAAIGRLAEKTAVPFTARYTLDDAPALSHPAVEELLATR